MVTGTWGSPFALYCLVTIYSCGYLAIAEFELPSAPAKDSDRKQNHEVLQKLPEHIATNVDLEQWAYGILLHDMALSVTQRCRRRLLATFRRMAAWHRVRFAPTIHICMPAGPSPRRM